VIVAERAEKGLRAGLGIYRSVDGPAVTLLNAVLANDMLVI
jgi:hypothetical protein